MTHQFYQYILKRKGGNEHMGGYNLLDTRSFDKFLSQKSMLIQKYNKITMDYDEIVKELVQNWEGKGAEAFKKDAENVKANLTGIQDILVTMCDTLESCKEIFQECDTALGEANQEN